MARNKIELFHPNHGVCATHYYDELSSRTAVIIKWKSTYGKKYYECELIENTVNSSSEKSKKIKEEERITGQIIIPSVLRIRDKLADGLYLNYAEAAKASGLSANTVRLHCKAGRSSGKTKGSFKDGIRFSFVNVKLEANGSS